MPYLDNGQRINKAGAAAIPPPELAVPPASGAAPELIPATAGAGGMYYAEIVGPGGLKVRASGTAGQVAAQLRAAADSIAPPVQPLVHRRREGPF